jgi:hypothetical protein
MINADMIAHRSPSEPAQLGLPAQGAPGTREVAYLVGNLSNIYSPDLKVGWTSVRYMSCPLCQLYPPPLRRLAVAITKSVRSFPQAVVHPELNYVAGQSFHIQGFPATQRLSLCVDLVFSSSYLYTSSLTVFERAGPLIDPMYHTSGSFFFPLIWGRTKI